MPNHREDKKLTQGDIWDRVKNLPFVIQILLLGTLLANVETGGAAAGWPPNISANGLPSCNKSSDALPAWNTHIHKWNVGQQPNVSQVRFIFCERTWLLAFGTAGGAGVENRSTIGCAVALRNGLVVAVAGALPTGLWIFACEGKQNIETSCQFSSSKISWSSAPIVANDLHSMKRSCCFKPSTKLTQIDWGKS